MLIFHDGIADGIADLGRPEEISKIFVGFQKFLYQPHRVTRNRRGRTHFGHSAEQDSPKPDRETQD